MTGGKRNAHGPSDPPAPGGAGPVRVNRRVLLGAAVGIAAPTLAAGMPPIPAPRAVTALQATPAAERRGDLEVVRNQRPPTPEEPTPGGRLRLLLPRPGVGGDVEGFSPVAFRQSFQVLASHLDPLLRVDDVTLEPRPWLAERWEWSDDGRVVTYALRRDVVWHDGAPLSAEDVVFSLVVARDDVDSGVRNFFSLMIDAIAVDDYTVRVTLSDPDGGWLFNASSQFVCQRAQYLEHWEARPAGERTLSDFGWRESPPRGTGPWAVAEWSEIEVAFERHGAYWAGASHAEGLVVAWEDDAADRVATWVDRDTDVTWPVRPDAIADASEAPGRLYAVDVPRVMFAAFNFDNPARRAQRSRLASDIFADVRVRRALSLAIDRERYAAEVFDGFVRAERAGTVAQPWAHDPSLINPPRDVPGALALLREAGWEDRDGSGVLENSARFTFEITAIVRDDAAPALLAVMDRVVADLAEIGVRLDFQRLEATAFRERWVNGHDFDLIAYAYDLYPGFTDFDLYGSGWDIRVNPQGWNPGGYRNAEVDAAIAAALSAVDVRAQGEALGRLQRAANEDLFALWFGFPQELVLVADDVVGFQPHALWPTWNTRAMGRRG